MALLQLLDRLQFELTTAGIVHASVNASGTGSGAGGSDTSIPAKSRTVKEELTQLDNEISRITQMNARLAGQTFKQMLP